MRRLTPALLIALLVAAPAGAAYEQHSVDSDLDADGSLEEVRTARHVSDGLERTVVQIADECDAGSIAKRVAGPQDALAFLRVFKADDVAGNDVFIDLRSGATARSGELRLVAWRPISGPSCGKLRKLFTYKSSRPTKRPKGASFLANFGAVVKDFAEKRPGRELRLDEHFAREGEGSCCPSITKRTYFSYDAASDAYERYRTRVKRREPNL